MPKSRIPSPARSQGAAMTPRRYKPRRSRSVCSPALSITSGRLTSVIDQLKENNLNSFTCSPLSSRRSVLTDKTDIEEPGRKSWWKNLNENSRDVMEVLDDNKITDANKAIEELFEIEVLRQQDNKNYTLDLPDSSDNESIKSVVLPQKKLFTQKDNPRQKNIFGGLLTDRETLNKFRATNITQHDETVNAGTKNLFQGTNRPKPVFDAELLNMSSPHETNIDNTKINITIGSKIAIKNLFGNKPNSKRKNIFAEFIASESEHEISDVQPKVFYFQKQKEDHRIHSFSKDKEHFLTSSINNEIEPEDWQNLPSSTMVENQIDEIVGGPTPIKRVRLSNLLEIKESEAESITNMMVKTKELNNSVNVLNKSVSSQAKDIIVTEDNAVATVTISNIANKTDNVSVESSSKNTSKTYAQDKTKSKDEGNMSKLVIANATTKVSSNDQEIEDDFTLEYEADIVVIGENQGTSSQKPHIDSKNDINNTVIEKDRTKIQDEISALDELVVKRVINKSFIESTHNESENKANKSIKRSESTNNSLEKQQESIKVVECDNQNLLTDNIDGLSHVAETTTSKRRDENEELEMGVVALDNIDRIRTADLVYKDKENAKATFNVTQDRDKYQEVEITSTAIRNLKENDNQIENKYSNCGDDKDRESQVDEAIETSKRETCLVQDDNGCMKDENNKSLEELNNRTKDVEHIENNQSKVDDEEVNHIQETTNEIEDNENEEDEHTEHEEDELTENEDDEHTENEEDIDESQDHENDDESSKSQDTENDLNESQTTENDSESEEQNVDDSIDDDDRTDATDDVLENQEKIEIDNNEEQCSEHVESSVTRNEELIEKSPEHNHDTTDSSNNKMKSPDVILHGKIHHQDSFTINAPDTNSRRSKSVYNQLNIRSVETARNSLGANHTEDSSAEGSGWDSHRTTRKTLRQTFGRDFTLRKSLRTLVLEKSAKTAENAGVLHSETVKLPQANSTAYPENFNPEDNEVNATIESDHDVSRKMRQTTLETYLQKIKQRNLEVRLQMEESIKNSFKPPTAMDTLNLFKVPLKPPIRKIKPTTNETKKQIKSLLLFDELPSGVIEDMKYKPPKRFRPSNASWITKRLYKFLETKLEPKYDYRARVRAEKLVEIIYHFTKELRRHDIATKEAVDMLKNEFARLDVVKTHFEFYEFFHEFMPREIRVKVVPDIVNKISLPRHGIFSDILRGNTVQG